MCVTHSSPQGLLWAPLRERVGGWVALCSGSVHCPVILVSFVQGIITHLCRKEKLSVSVAVAGSWVGVCLSYRDLDPLPLSHMVSPGLLLEITASCFPSRKLHAAFQGEE